MSAELKPDLQLEIAHVLFMDVVGYSQLLINDQSEILQQLNEIVRKTPHFREAEAAGKLIRLPTGDGMALVFFNNPEAPAQCALEISRALKNHPRIPVRMGVHSGPVNSVSDVNDRSNVTGAGINMAQRVMDCGDAGHILLSKRLADDLAQYRHWQPHLHELREFTVKHGVNLQLVNLYTDEIGNPEVPAKLKRLHQEEPAAKMTSSAEGSGGRNRLLFFAALLLALILGVGLWKFSHRTSSKPAAAPIAEIATPTPRMDSKSVAVLPFENLSSDKENAFFAQGIQDEIITTLSRISGLKVISRTSTANYKSKPENLPEIARELRVANILEGSVQKVGEKVHINVQLIQADTDAHLWAQSYDRQLTDIFNVEAEVAKSIADSLSATLSPQEKERVEAKPTNNADAYVLYWPARQYQTRPDNLLQDFESAVRLYEQAIALDPSFALAHARLSATESTIYHFFEPTETRKQKADAEAAESLRLHPDLGEGHLALGLYFYYEKADYEKALKEFHLAGIALPNDGDVGLYIAAVERRRGHWADCIAAYRAAEAIDPRNSVMLYDAAQTYFGLRDWQTAMERMDRVLTLAPDSLNVKIQRGYLEFFAKGSTAPIKTALDQIPPNMDPDGIVTCARWEVGLMDRDPATAEKALAQCRLESVTSQTGVPLPKSYLQACVDLVRGDAAKARAGFEAARPILEATVAKSPQDAIRHAQLGLLYAFMGRKADALREGERAIQLKPISRDVIEGAAAEDFLALICARTGQPDQAIARVERLLSTPFAVDYAEESITLSDLRTRWQWDPLRNDPRFQKLVSGPEPKTIYK